MTRLGDKVPVEELSADRIDRIEGAVLAAYRATDSSRAPRGWGWLRLSVPVVAVAAVVALVWFARAGGDAPTAAHPTHVVAADGGSTIDLGGASVQLSPGAEIDIRREHGGIQVALARGTIECEVEPRKARPPFVVEAGTVDVIVVGTRFRVARDGDDVEVSVTRGKVRVEAAGDSELVAAGQVWAAGRVATAGLAPADPEAHGAEPARDAESAGAAGPAVAAAEPPAAAAETVPPVRRKPVRPRSPRPERKTAPATGGDGFAGYGPPTLVAPSAEPGSANREGVYAAAFTAYRARDRAEALARLDYFDRRFDTKGAFTEAALKLRIRIECTRASSGCRKAAYRYLERYPNGDYRDQARALTNWM